MEMLQAEEIGKGAKTSQERRKSKNQKQRRWYLKLEEAVEHNWCSTGGGNSLVFMIEYHGAPSLNASMVVSALTLMVQSSRTPTVCGNYGHQNPPRKELASCPGPFSGNYPTFAARSNGSSRRPRFWEHKSSGDMSCRSGRNNK